SGRPSRRQAGRWRVAWASLRWMGWLLCHGPMRFETPGRAHRRGGNARRTNVIPSAATNVIPRCARDDIEGLGMTTTASRRPHDDGPGAIAQSARRLLLPRQHQLLDLADRLGRVQALRAGARAVEDGVAAVQLERILEVVQARAGVLVAAVDDPAVGLQQHGRAEVAVAVPPVARAAGGAAAAQDAFVQAVELGAILLRLQPLAIGGRRALGADPRLDRSVLRVEVGHVRDQVLDHPHRRQRVDRHRALALDRRPLRAGVERALRLAGLLDRADAGQRVGAVDVHRARAADALAAGAAEGQGRVDLVLDLDQRVQDHRPALVQVDLVGVQARVLVVVRAPAIDLELAHALRAGGRGVALV